MLRLKHALETKSMTLKGCSELLGVTEKTLYNKIVGNTEFTYSEVRKLKTLLPEYDINYLLSAEDDQDAD